MAPAGRWGGQAWESAQLIMTHLPKLEIPTYTYVNPNAVSAGAIIALGTDVIYMAPTSAIGAAAVVTATGGDLGGSFLMNLSTEKDGKKGGKKVAARG